MYLAVHMPHAIAMYSFRKPASHRKRQNSQSKPSGGKKRHVEEEEEEEAGDSESSGNEEKEPVVTPSQRGPPPLLYVAELRYIPACTIFALRHTQKAALGMGNSGKHFFDSQNKYTADSY